jgi:hypothetical protein
VIIRSATYLLLALGVPSICRADQPIDVTLRVGERAIATRVDGRWASAARCDAQDVHVRPEAGTEHVTVEGDLASLPVRAIRPGVDEWLHLAPTVLRLFDQREREARLVPDQTSAAPRAIDWIYSADVAGRRQYYFEASRRVSSVRADVDLDTDPPGTSRVAVSGFLRADPDGLSSIGIKSEMHWKEDSAPAGPPTPDLTPLGVVVDRDRSIWVMKGQSGSRDWFALFDVGQRGVRTLVNTRTDCR